MGFNGNSSDKKINEALELLNEAALEKKDEIQRLLSDKYQNAKEIFQEAAEQGRDRFDQVKEAAEQALENSGDALKQIAEDIDKDARKNPWAYIAGAAVVTLLLGYILGSSKKN